MANKSKRFGTKYYALLALVMVTVVVLSLATPIRQEALDKYHLSELQLRFISIGTLQLPLFGIWLAALYGFVRSKQYAIKIKGDPDGKAFNVLSNGLGVLAFSLPVNSLVSGVFSYFTARDLSLIPYTTTITQYISLAFSFVGLYLVSKGSKGLAHTTKAKVRELGQGWLPIVYGAAGIGYAYLILSRSIKRVAPTATSRATYYLPDWAIATTILLPYLVAWYFGIMAVYYLAAYSKNVPGQLYQRALKHMAWGVGFVVSLAIALQLLSIFGTELQGLDIKWLLGIIYVLVIFIAIGYIFIARGAKLLRKIEEV